MRWEAERQFPRTRRGEEKSMLKYHQVSVFQDENLLETHSGSGCLGRDSAWFTSQTTTTASNGQDGQVCHLQYHSYKELP